MKDIKHLLIFLICLTFLSGAIYASSYMFSDLSLVGNDYSANEKNNIYKITLPIEETYPESTGSIFSVSYANNKLNLANDSTDIHMTNMVDSQSTEIFTISIDSNKSTDKDYQLDIYYSPQFITSDNENSGINVDLEVSPGGIGNSAQALSGYKIQKGLEIDSALSIPNFPPLTMNPYKLTVFQGYHDVDILSFVMSWSLEEVQEKSKQLASREQLRSLVLIDIRNIE